MFPARHVATGVFEQRRDEGRGGGFAVGTGYGDDALSVGVRRIGWQFNFADELLPVVLTLQRAFPGCPGF